MSWMEQLIRTYDANVQIAGKFDAEGQKHVLTPVGHTIQAAQIEITLNREGKLLQATVVTKDEKETLLPCTPESASRANSVEPHLLHDNLRYIARDYDLYNKEQSSEKEYYTKYKSGLAKWAMSSFGHPKVTAVYQYISHNDIIHDLINCKILFTMPDGSLMEKWTGDIKDKPPIFAVSNGEILKSFVRFKVELEDGTPAALWKDRVVQQSFIQFYKKSMQEDERLCYATGKLDVPIRLHSKYIRYGGDGAKLISSNDTSGFTFRGRFTSSEECANVGYHSSQKAMNALKWLVRNQGYTYYGKVFLAWGIGQTLPPMLGDSVDVISRVRQRRLTADLQAETMHDFGQRFRQAIAGYKLDLETVREDINVMVLDAATPGRLSICFYQELLPNDFIRRIEEWHIRGRWRQYKVSTEKGVPGFYYQGVPAPKRLIEECYGDSVGETKARAAMERIFHCIINGQALPRDMMLQIRQRVIQRAVKTVGSEFYTWERILMAACSIIRNYYYQTEVYNVELNMTSQDRSYLYGRLLAVADWMERSTFDKETDRLTNALQYMNAFSQRPGRTWAVIYKKLLPYQAKLGRLGNSKINLLDEIMVQFKPGDFSSDSSDKALDSKFLLGYHSQRYAFQLEVQERTRLKKEREAAAKAVCPQEGGIDNEHSTTED